MLGFIIDYGNCWKNLTHFRFVPSEQKKGQNLLLSNVACDRRIILRFAQEEKTFRTYHLHCNDF